MYAIQYTVVSYGATITRCGVSDSTVGKKKPLGLESRLRIERVPGVGVDHGATVALPVCQRQSSYL